jgi:hypothetical protein
MSELDSLELRANAAIAKLKTPPSPMISDTSEETEKLTQDVAKLKEELEKEQRVHNALQVEFLDVCQEFGAMELDHMSSADKTGSETQNEDTKAGIEKLRRERERDVAEVDEILGLLTPLVEG